VLPGVRRITASYKKQLMESEFDERELSIEQIISAANDHRLSSSTYSNLI